VELLAENAGSRPSLQLPVGTAGKVGFVEMEFAPSRGLTRLVRSRYQIPLQLLRAMHYDSAEPTMAYMSVIAPVGGVVQGDRLKLSAKARAGAAAHVTTVSATNVYSMETDYGSLEEELCVDADAYLEYLPDPIIPHRNARYRQSTRLVVDPDGCLVYGEILLPGRIHMNAEVFQYDEVDFRLRALRPDGSLLFVDHFLLEPKQMNCDQIGRVGSLGIITTIYVLCPPRYLPDLRQALSEASLQPPLALVGFSELPESSGMMLRGLTADTVLAGRLLTSAWQAARRVLRGTPIPEVRKY
jgi:urease accessory protein